MADQAAKDAQLKAFSVELARLDISVLRKEEIKQRFSKIRKALDTQLKARSAAEVKAAQEAVTKYFEEHPEAPVYITKLDVDANNKALQSGIAAAKKLGKPVYLFAQDKSGADPCKTLYSNYVPEAAQQRGLNAVEWNRGISEMLHGRGGGKPDGAQGVGEAPRSAVDDAMKLAEELFRMKIQ